MIVVHQGFDALSVAVKVDTPPPLLEALEVARAAAERSGEDEPLEFGGMRFKVAPFGARGGYSFRAVSVADDMAYLFKRPKARDPWGVFVSAASETMCRCTFRQAKAAIVETLGALGIATKPSDFAINRVDYAIDLLPPGFVLEPRHMVCHSKMKKCVNDGIEWHVCGDRVYAVRAGKNPNKQVAIYDKRKDVIEKGKSYWWRIWNDALIRQGLPPLASRDADIAQIWRFELRLFKRHLKDDCEIATFEALELKLQAALLELIDDIRLTVPHPVDTNRTRWDSHPTWRKVREVLTAGLFDGAAPIPAEVLRAIRCEEQARILVRQGEGLAASFAALHGLEGDNPAPLAARYLGAVGRDIDRDPDRFGEALRRARKRYIGMEPA